MRRVGAWGSRLTFSVAIVLVCASLSAQTVLDQVLVRFGGEIVTQLDVRQARMLKLVTVATDTDQAYVDALVNRRLILAELRRMPPAEPAAEAVDLQRRQWERAVGAGGTLTEVLERAGMTEAGLRGWLRDDVRIQTYVDERFGGRANEVASWLAALRQRAAIR